MNRRTDWWTEWLTDGIMHRRMGHQEDVNQSNCNPQICLVIFSHPSPSSHTQHPLPPKKKQSENIKILQITVQKKEQFLRAKEFFHTFSYLWTSLWDIHLFVLFPCRVRTKFSVVNDDGEGQLMRTRSRPRKLGPRSQKAEPGKEWKGSKSTSYRQNIDTNLLQNSSYQNENTGHITPLPPPLVSI